MKDIFLKLIPNTIPKKLHEFHNDLPFLSERIKIEKVEKLIATLWNKNEYVIHISSLKKH